MVLGKDMANHSITSSLFSAWKDPLRKIDLSDWIPLCLTLGT